MKPGILPITLVVLSLSGRLTAGDATRTYDNQLQRILQPAPLLADHAEWVEPIRETNRWEARLALELQRPRHYRDAQPSEFPPDGGGLRASVGH
jgi:hypothetical protein